MTAGRKVTEPDLETLERCAAAYEKRLVPALFAPWTETLLEAARIRPGQRALDVACGTGVLARAAAARIGPGGSVAGLDPNPGMLKLAAQIAPEVEWRRGLAEALPYRDRTFDAVLSQFGMMFFGARAEALREMRRVLAEGGRLAAAVFDRPAEPEAQAALEEIYVRHAGATAAAFLQQPYCLADPPALAAAFEAAGFAEVAVTRRVGRARFASVRDLVLSDVEAWFPLAGLALEPATAEALVADAEAAFAPQVAPGEAVEIPVPALIVTAVKE